MHLKNKSVPASAVSIPVAESAPCETAEISRYKDGADCPSIDFTSPEFNVMDDLDDNTGNYRNFQKLDNIVTADMRHQEKRKHLKSTQDKTGKAPLQDNLTEPSGGREEENRYDISPITLTSRGRTLIIDTDPDRALGCSKLLIEHGLTCTIFLVTDDAENIPAPRTGELPYMRAASVTVRGGFGGFTAMIGGSGSQREADPMDDNKKLAFDLVLDLQATPSFAGQQLPLGYYTPGDDRTPLDEALAELPEMKGVFAKPRFTVFLQENCLYGRSRTHACQQCMHACPMGAVRLERGTIYLDPYLCQGCGSCALVCPADAIHMLNPAREELLTGIRDLLAEHAAATDSPPVLVLHGEGMHSEELFAIQGSQDGTRLLFFAVQEIGRIGSETMLAALAYGAGAVVVACGRGLAPEIVQALEQQRRIGAAVLQGLKMPEDRISLFVLPSGANDAEKTGPRVPFSETRAAVLSASPAPLSPDNDRRALTRLAVQHLAGLSSESPASVSLPDDAPFGTVVLEEACTLCMACAGACPTGALTAGGDLPRLYFAENLCHQCGLCLEVCPEAAVQLRPRLLCTGDDHGPPIVLQETEPVSCIECGAPFASRAMIDRLQDKLAGHWMYRNDRQLRRLRMCRTCSTRDALLAKDFKS